MGGRPSIYVTLVVVVVMMVLLGSDIFQVLHVVSQHQVPQWHEVTVVLKRVL